MSSAVALYLAMFSGVAEVFAFARLILSASLRRHSWFGALLLMGAVQGGALLWLDYYSRAYAVWWAATSLLLVALRIAVVIESWRVLMSSYPGIDRIAGKVAALTVAFALLLAIFTGLDKFDAWHIPWSRPEAIFAVSVLVRWSSSALTIICSFLFCWAVLFPMGVPKNLVWHLGMLTSYFGFQAAAFLLINFRLAPEELIPVLLTSATAGLYVLWGCSFRKSGAVAAGFEPASLEDIEKLKERDRTLYGIGREALRKLGWR